jgi:hypothetical protein
MGRKVTEMGNSEVPCVRELSISYAPHDGNK